MSALLLCTVSLARCTEGLLVCNNTIVVQHLLPMSQRLLLPLAEHRRRVAVTDRSSAVQPNSEGTNTVNWLFIDLAALNIGRLLVAWFY